jgi:hypothetical protein
MKTLQKKKSEREIMERKERMDQARSWWMNILKLIVLFFHFGHI